MKVLGSEHLNKWNSKDQKKPTKARISTADGKQEEKKAAEY